MSDIISANKYRRGTKYYFTYPTLPSLQLTPRRVEIHQKPYHHDVLIMEFSQTSMKWFEVMKTGVPVQFDWSQNELSNTWVGYVSFISKHVAGQKEELMEVHCIGSTFPLKERVSKVFLNTTIPNAVKEIVTEFGFKYIGDDDGIVYEQIAIAGHSYWEWIHEYAKRIGYGVIVDKMNFYFRPLDKLINQGITSVPVLAITEKEFGINNQLYDRTLDSFKVINGEHVEGFGAQRATKTVSGVDPLTGIPVSSVSSPKTVGDNLRDNVSDVLFSEIDSAKVAHSTEQAKGLSDGSAHLGRFNMPARIKCQGDPRIKPFTPVLIQGTGPLTDGFWVADEVKHMFSRLGDYLIEMRAVVDGTGLDQKLPKRQWVKDPVGVVNLTEALESGSNQTSSSTVVLNAKAIAQQENNQGFRRTPGLWQSASGRGK